MPTLKIIPDGEGAFSHLDPKKRIDSEDISVFGLEGGMQSGLPSVGFIIELPDGRHVFAQTSMRLFLVAAEVFKAKYGNLEDADPKGSPS